MMQRPWSNDKAPVLLRYRSADWFITTAVTLAVFTDIFLYAVIVPVIPFALESKASIAPEQSQYWISVLIAVYGASLLALSPICGWLADKYSNRRVPLVVGLFALLGATVMLHVAGSIAVLVVARLLQGASAAVVWVVGLALLADTVGSEGVGVAIGYVAVGMSIGMLVGPLLGGVVYDHGGYNAVFAMCYILIGIDVFLRVVLIEKKVAARWISQGSHTASATMGEIDRVTVIPSPTENPNTRPQSSPAQQIGSSQDDPSPSKSPQENINTTTSPSPPLTRSHSKRRYKLPPIIFLLSSKRMCAALFATLALASLISCFDSVMPLYVKRLWGWSSTGAGLIFLPVVIPTLISPAVGWLTDRYGARWPATIGFVLATPCYVCLRFVDENTLSDKVLLCALLGLAGVALTLSLGPIMAEITYQVSAKEEKHPGIFGAGGAYAQAYGLFNMAFAGGTVVGPIWSGFVNEKAGWATMAWTLALLSIVTAVPTAMYVGGELSFSKGVGREKRK